jgi:hypothetical protein
VKKNTNLSGIEKTGKLGVKKITLRDLDDSQLNAAAGAAPIEPTTTVLHTHQTSCIATVCK